MSEVPESQRLRLNITRPVTIDTYDKKNCSSLPFLQSAIVKRFLHFSFSWVVFVIIVTNSNPKSDSMSWGGRRVIFFRFYGWRFQYESL